MRISVYDEHWHTVGGGEKLAASYAAALRPFGDVELLAHAPVDAPLLEERLGVDLHGIGTRVIGDGGAAVASAASGDYDLFVNCSYLSKVTSRARRSIYAVQFPERAVGLRSSSARLLLDHLDPFLRTCDIEYGPGFHPPEHDGTGTFRWTSGEAAILFRNHSEDPLPGRLTLTAAHCPGQSVELTVTVDGTTTPRTIGADPTDVYVEVRPLSLVEVRLSMPTWTVGGDPRNFGIQLLDAGSGPAVEQALRDAASHEHHIEGVFRFLDSYDLITAISPFTARAIEDFWGRSSVIIHPAVGARRGAEYKRRSIVSVGRFFSGGHSKKQVELVEAFRQLATGPWSEGWTLDLIGGASPRDRYVDDVRHAALGLPVHVHVDAPGAVVDGALAAASVYWHGAGIGEDLRDPIRFEHFGISVVEAMSAGCVPVVYGHGGPADIVEDGISGLHYFDLDELASATALLLAEPALLRTMAAAARRRAEEFDERRFEAAVAAVVGDLVSA